MYLNFPSLQVDPFRIAPDPRFLYLGKQHSRARSYIQSTGFLTDGFVIITGEIGAGKTILINDFLASLPSSTVAVAIHQTQITPVQFLQSFLVRLGVDPFDKKKVELLSLINEQLQRNHSAGKQTVLVLDEAQNLDYRVLEEIRLLAGIETGHERIFSVILAGQPGLRDKLLAPEMAQLAQRAPLHFHLKPLEPAETQRYVAHRLSVAGDTESAVFLPEAIDLVHRYTGGLPRLINILCGTSLLCAFAEGEEVVAAATLHEALHELQWETVAQAENRESQAPRSARRRDRKNAHRNDQTDAQDEAPVNAQKSSPKRAPQDAQESKPRRSHAEIAALSETILALKDALKRERQLRLATEAERVEAGDDAMVEAPPKTRVSAATPARARIDQLEAADKPREVPSCLPESVEQARDVRISTTQPDAGSARAHVAAPKQPAQPQEQVTVPDNNGSEPHGAESAKPALNSVAGNGNGHPHSSIPRIGSLIGLDDAATPHAIHAGRLRIGSSPDNDIRLQKEFVSPHHAELIGSTSDCVLKDLNSTNGTYVNARRIMRHSLRDGDQITIGNHQFRYIGNQSPVGTNAPEDGDRIRVSP